MALVIVMSSVVVVALAYPAATAARDELQDSLARRRKLKSSGSRKGNRILLILFLPITLYIILGTLSLLLLTIVELVTKKLRRYAGASQVEAIAWHEVSVLLTLLFPLAWPVLALIVGVVFAGAVFLAILTAARRFLDATLRLLRRIWVVIIHTLRDILEWITGCLRVIWEQIVDGMQNIWAAVVSTTQMVFEQINALMHEIWESISSRIRV